MDESLNRIPAGFFSFDDDGVLLETNETLEKMLGYAREELQGKPVADILALGGRIYYQTHFFPALRLQGRLNEIYLKLAAKDGAIVPVLTNAQRCPQENGDFKNECVVIRMTQRDRYEDEILRAKRGAEVANDAKAKFISMISHELRTPLQSIIGYVDLLANAPDASLTAEQRADLGAIRAAGGNLARMLDDIFQFARLDAGTTVLEFTRFSLWQAIHRAHALVKPRLEKAGLIYECETIPEGIAVWADDYRLQQIFLNLLVNAIKFTPARGRITITCRWLEGSVSTDISDTGPGIAQDDLEKIFEPFVQLNPETGSSGGGGVGLGLSISRDLARAMGGDVTVKSELGKGATFTVTLPRAGDS